MILPALPNGQGARRPSLEAQKALGGPLSNGSHTCPQPGAAWCFRSEGPRSGSRQPIRSGGPREGRRPDERPGRGRRHLVDNSQVSDKAAMSANGAGGFERTAFQDAFLSSPREARKADFRLENPRLWKIFTFAKPSQTFPSIRGQGQSPALSAFCASKPSNLESLTRGGRTRKGVRLLLLARHDNSGSGNPPF